MAGLSVEEEWAGIITKNQEGRNSQNGSENEEKSILMCYWYLWNKVSVDSAEASEKFLKYHLNCPLKDGRLEYLWTDFYLSLNEGWSLGNDHR